MAVACTISGGARLRAILLRDASSRCRLAALLCKPIYNFRRPDNPSWQNRIQRSRVDFNAFRDLARGKLFGGGFAVKSVRATGIMPGLFMMRNAGRDVPCFQDSLVQDAPPAPVDIAPDFVAAFRRPVHMMRDQRGAISPLAHSARVRWRKSAKTPFEIASRMPCISCW
jgi:hypothetical protein